jgi:hypothetical protein
MFGDRSSYPAAIIFGATYQNSMKSQNIVGIKLIGAYL